MFTGLIEEVGSISELNKNNDGIELIVKAQKVLNGLRVNDSISCSGICLTVIQKYDNAFKVQIVHETINKTTAKIWEIDSLINLERSLLPTTRMGGHFVQGHIDTTTHVQKIIHLGKSWLISFGLPKKYKKFLIEKGSITINGVSLTIVKKINNSFQISIIPHTLRLTNLIYLKENDLVNVEFDVLGKYIRNFIK